MSRAKGKDYIVLVGRERTKHGWIVDIAEVGTVLPVASYKTFTEPISIQTKVTLRNRKRWFHIPSGELIPVDDIFRRCFDSVFPNQWDKLYAEYFSEDECSSGASEGDASKEEDASNEATVQKTDTVATLQAELEHLSTANWDDSDYMVVSWLLTCWYPEA